MSIAYNSIVFEHYLDSDQIEMLLIYFENKQEIFYNENEIAFYPLPIEALDIVYEDQKILTFVFEKFFDLALLLLDAQTYF